MPREIITLQVGQCGNQSNALLEIINLPYLQSETNSGSRSARSMESTLKESWKSMPLWVMIGKMFSSIKMTTSITFPAHFQSTLNQESSTRFKMDFIKIYTILRTSLSPRKVAEQETTGPMVSSFTFSSFFLSTKMRKNT